MRQVNKKWSNQPKQKKMDLSVNDLRDDDDDTPNVHNRARAQFA